MLNIDDQAQTTVQPIAFDSMEGLSADDAAGDEESAPKVQVQIVQDETHQPVVVVDVLEKNDDLPKE
nr:hypothetical protein CFP56_42762 [Quercus suber]